MLKPSLSDLVKSSFRSIAKNKSRTLLTSLGIIIGVTSVILLTSIGTGLKKYVNNQFESLGANSIFIYPGQIFSESGGFSRSGGFVTTNFDLRDVNTLRRKLPSFTIMPASVVFADIKYASNTQKAVEIGGSDHNYGPNSNLTPSADNGRWFTKEEEDKKKGKSLGF